MITAVRRGPHLLVGLLISMSNPPDAESVCSDISVHVGGLEHGRVSFKLDVRNLNESFARASELGKPHGREALSS